MEEFKLLTWSRNENRVMGPWRARERESTMGVRGLALPMGSRDEASNHGGLRLPAAEGR